MANRHNSIKRIVHRCVEELKATADLAAAISLRAALLTLRAKIDIQIMNRNGFKEPISVRKRLLRKHEIMLDYLEHRYLDYWNNYHCVREFPAGDEALRNKIWVCWWQGLENAPEIVNVCVESIKQNAGKHEVICITEKNYREYVQFPSWIEKKREQNIISRTILSDILRMALLAKYGGIWIDSTFFCRETCFDEYLTLPIWSIKRPDYLHCSVASGYFANYSLGCTYENRWVFCIIRDFLYNYWKENDKLIDYLLTDYVIVLAQRHNPEIAELFKNIEPNNPNCDELWKILGKSYDIDLWNNIKKDTVLYKLTWKQNFAKEVNGAKTFYARLIEQSLV